MTLEFTDRAIVVAAVPGDVTPRVTTLDAASCLADDQGDLGFVVESVRLERPHDRGTVTGLRLGCPQEHCGIGHFVIRGLGAMVLVVDTDTQDLARIGDYR